jgi:hypothetical protein
MNGLENISPAHLSGHTYELREMCDKQMYQITPPKDAALLLHIKETCAHCQIYNDCGYRRQRCQEECKKVKESFRLTML